MLLGETLEWRGRIWIAVSSYSNGDVILAAIPDGQTRESMGLDWNPHAPETDRLTIKAMNHNYDADAETPKPS